MGYYIGLDMGTASVGWAVTDERYNLLRKKGKDMWGVRLFDEADTSAERRAFRTGRRRRQREKARIGYLKEIFAPAINAVDPGFLARLDDSFFHREDKKIRQPFALFADTGFTDREYYREFPTIFHLRRELVVNPAPHDVRLVYLAVLNLFKHRGHFLTPNLAEGSIGEFSERLEELREAAERCLGIPFPLPEAIGGIEAIVRDRALKKTEKLDRIRKTAAIAAASDSRLVPIWELALGGKVPLSKIFTDISGEEEKKLGICFADASYEEKEQKAADILSEEAFDLLLAIKGVYDWSLLAAIMTGRDGVYPYISQAHVAAYDKHRADLKRLKAAYALLPGEKYDAMFRSMAENTYSAYVGSVNSGKQKVRRGCDAPNFFKKISDDLKALPDAPEGGAVLRREILEEIGKGTFLPLQRTSDNGVIPNQINKTELGKILRNAEEYLPFLKERDPESGLSATERLLELFSFRIPYYVGPVRGVEGSPCWAVRKEAGRILPWNIGDRIDMATTARNFMENLVGHCSWLNEEKVLPKSSLLYERFMLLNELNNLTIHGEKISPELKQKLYRDLFAKTGKKVTNKKLVTCLRQNGILGPDEGDEVLGGYDKESGGFANTLANHRIFMDVFETDVLTDEQVAIAEECIFYATVYGDSKKFLREKLLEVCGDRLSEGRRKRILGIKFRDWGNLSKEFLLLEGADTATGEVLPLVTRMWRENKNLMQLLDQQNYTYRDAVLERTAQLEKALSEICPEDLEGKYLSAPVKRMVWQTIRIVQEIVKVMQEEPARIFIEVTRSEEKKKTKKDSRKAKLLALYKKCGEEAAAIARELGSRDENDLLSKRLYLYYMQKGRCLYSGEPIPLDDLFNKNLYDIDHIYPRSAVKDDSLENNLVLVRADLNRAKTNSFPIDESVRKNCAGLWKNLKEGGFITAEKYGRLTRTQPFSQEELAGFVNRQLVETGQGTKAVAGLLTQVFGGRANDRVIYVKAGNVSEFRQTYDLIKCRDVNDFHHANDAYLNIVVGNAWFTKFTRDARYFFAGNAGGREGTAGSFNLKNLFRFRIARGGTVAWEPDEDIRTVKGMMAKNTPLVTKRTFEAHGGFYDQQIVGAHKMDKADLYLPIKSSDERLLSLEKYGGFKDVAGAYFFLVEHTEKKKRVRTLEFMPVYLAKDHSGREEIERYCRDRLGLVQPSVRMVKIRMYSLLRINGFPVFLAGRSNDRINVCNAVQLVLNNAFCQYVRKIAGALEKKYDDSRLQAEQERIARARAAGGKETAITAERNAALYDLLLKKHTEGIFAKKKNSIGPKLEKGRESFLALGLSKQCSVLYQILQISRLVNNGVDLSDIGGAKSTGVARCSKKIGGLKECTLVLQSVTGLYEQRVDLLTI